MLPEQVQRLHTPHWGSISAKQKIKAYFEALGLPGDLAIEPIAERLQTQFPNQLKAFADAVVQQENSSNRTNIYEEKNSSLEFSLLAGAAFKGTIHKTVMR